MFSDLLYDVVLVWSPYLLDTARPTPHCFHATYLLQCRRMAFHLTRRRIDYPSTNLWRCLYQVTYHIIITFIIYSHPDLSRRHRTAAYILSSARWEERTQYDMAFCGVSFLTAGYVTSCFTSVARIILRCRSRTETLVGYPGSPRGGCFLTPLPSM